MSRSIIEIHNLRKGYASQQGELESLQGINLTIPEASIVGIIGKSGAGKTTLLRCLNFLETPNSGQILIQGQEFRNFRGNQLKSFRQKIGTVFQSFHLINNNTVFKNIALPLEIRRLNQQEIYSRVNEIAALVGLELKLNSYPSQLSGGQKQRVAIARALVSETQILLCDEFTSALDPETTQEILELIKGLRARLKITIIIISHDMNVIRKICDFVYVLDAGQVIEQGPVERVLTTPQHLITKSLLGQVVSRGLL